MDDGRERAGLVVGSGVAYMGKEERNRLRHRARRRNHYAGSGGISSYISGVENHWNSKEIREVVNGSR